MMRTALATLGGILSTFAIHRLPTLPTAGNHLFVARAPTRTRHTNPAGLCTQRPVSRSLGPRHKHRGFSHLDVPRSAPRLHPCTTRPWWGHTKKASSEAACPRRLQSPWNSRHKSECWAWGSARRAYDARHMSRYPSQPSSTTTPAPLPGEVRWRTAQALTWVR